MTAFQTKYAYNYSNINKMFRPINYTHTGLIELQLVLFYINDDSVFLICLLYMLSLLIKTFSARDSQTPLMHSYVYMPFCKNDIVILQYCSHMSNTVHSLLYITVYF